MSPQELRLVRKLGRLFDLAVCANTRMLQYPSKPAGKKASVRFYEHLRDIQAVMQELDPPPFDGNDAAACGGGVVKRASLEEAERAARAMAGDLAKKVPQGWGFILWLSSFGEDGYATYLSNMQRNDALRSVAEWLETMKTASKTGFADQTGDRCWCCEAKEGLRVLRGVHRSVSLCPTCFGTAAPAMPKAVQAMAVGSMCTALDMARMACDDVDTSPEDAKFFAATIDRLNRAIVFLSSLPTHD